MHQASRFPAGSTMLHSLLFLLCALLYSANAVLVDFQVAQPPPVPQDTKQCTIQILQRDFAFSFGLAEIVQYTPPTDCGAPGTWAGVTLNFTVTSNGTQFDRLGIFTFQNVEIWRTSTPEPTLAGIIWTYVKDVTRFTPLFAKPGTFILQLDNLIETGLNGVYSTTLHATFHASSTKHPPAKQANEIIPLSTLANNTGDDASVPPSFSINVTLPRNTVSVYAEIIPSGNGNEEFWYFNIANDFLPDFPQGTLGQGPFREVRLLVDGMVAGVAFPYPVIFTGGILPPAWRPITSYGALDLPTYFIDVTPFVPLLTDGKAHNFTIDVASAETDRAILQNWFVSGLLQVVTDSSSKPTTGKMLSYKADAFATTSNTGSVDASNGDISITVSATRKIQISSEIVSGSGAKTLVSWEQDLSYVNQQDYLDNTLVQNLFQSSTGNSISSHNGVPTVLDNFSFPLTINFTSLNNAGTFFSTTFDHSYKRDVLPGLFLGSTIAERQLSGGFFNISSSGKSHGKECNLSYTFSGNTGNGTSNNTFAYRDTQGNTYQRRVNAAFNNITLDVVGGSLAAAPKAAPVESTHNTNSFAGARLPPGRAHAH
ncbi:peptide N-acetyl-beta-D-glucosaminyl asparaginase amidase A-domain-containing protein [Mycena amicta]|nr:peptide N-acetyl-beta-D-glucosaminyl asparaginase amidase A-domain-containing protein [Mycena amicta]